ncbi:jg27020 [Pararge aegeria aegeria]|uniref:Jg27020 protein n=1 Tax=Pararge aegeria aegeria TaxID=348720 RepID=A0A8S4SRC4_9NEOP|nr:jg27020 [Pararge aegeria aegeria]
MSPQLPIHHYSISRLVRHPGREGVVPTVLRSAVTTQHVIFTFFNGEGNIARKPESSTKCFQRCVESTTEHGGQQHYLLLIVEGDSCSIMDRYWGDVMMMLKLLCVEAAGWQITQLPLPLILSKVSYEVTNEI